MSPATKSKSKSAARAVKEQQQKVFSKLLAAPGNGGNGIPASAYNPISGTFHTLETVPSGSSPALQSNGRFRTIDESEEHYGSSNGTAEYDSVSNNDSCSGESEDQKDKAVAGSTPWPEAIPGSDSDKRDKIRQKNERKHQRQREKRARELNERCRDYLITRKLEGLSQQLVAMGFSQERASLALLRNEGRVEESVAWLFEGGEGEQPNVTNHDTRGNLKIDISHELAKIADLESRFSCSKQEVERAVVACEGDMDKAAETLKAQKQEPPAAPPKLEESGDPAAANTGHKAAIPTQSPITRTQVKAGSSVTTTQQQRKEERDLNYYSKAAVTGAVSLESGNKNLQPLRRLQTKPEWSRQQVATTVDKRWPCTSSNPSVSYAALASPLQVAVPPANAEGRCYTVVGGTDVKTNLQTGALREPVIVMQRPQSINAKQNPPSTNVSVNNALPPITTGWYPNGVGSIEMIKVSNGGLGHNLQNDTLRTTIPSPSLQYHQNHYQHLSSSSMEAGAVGRGGTWSTTGAPTGTLSSSSLAVPSCLGLFTGWGTSGSSSPVDWSTGGSMTRCDYDSIDWSLDSTPLWPKLGSSSLRSYQLYDTWAATFVGAKVARPGINVNGGVCMAAGFQDGGLAIEPQSSAGSHEWTSPFAGKDLLRVPRQFVASSSSSSSSSL